MSYPATRDKDRLALLKKLHQKKQKCGTVASKCSDKRKNQDFMHFYLHTRRRSNFCGLLMQSLNALKSHWKKLVTGFSESLCKFNATVIFSLNIFYYL